MQPAALLPVNDGLCTVQMALAGTCAMEGMVAQLDHVG